MSLPENYNFEPVAGIDDAPFITLRNTSITFSKSAIELMEYTGYVHMYIDRKKKVVAFEQCEKDATSIPFYKKPAAGKQILVRISNTERASLIKELAGIKDCGKGIRIHGEYLPENKTILFHLKNNQGT